MPPTGPTGYRLPCLRAPSKKPKQSCKKLPSMADDTPSSPPPGASRGAPQQAVRKGLTSRPERKMAQKRVTLRYHATKSWAKTDQLPYMVALYYHIG